MSRSFVRIMMGLIAWGLTFFASLSIAKLPGHWGHGICGPWGCGPPMQALLACHLSWLVLLLPLVALMQSRLSHRQLFLIGIFITAIGIFGTAGLAAYDFYSWWPTATETHRRYLLQRLGFVIVTQVDWPAIELSLTGVFLVIQGSHTRVHRKSSTWPSN